MREITHDYVVDYIYNEIKVREIIKKELDEISDMDPTIMAIEDALIQSSCEVIIRLLDKFGIGMPMDSLIQLMRETRMDALRYVESCHTESPVKHPSQWCSCNKINAEYKTNGAENNGE